MEIKRHKTDWGVEIGKKGLAICERIFNLSHLNGKPYQQVSSTPNETTSLLRPTSATDSNSSKPFDDEGYASKGAKDKKPVLPRPSLSEVFTKQSVINLAAYTLMALHAVAYDQLLPIFMHHPQQRPDSSNTNLPFKFSGGFGLGSGRIGTL